MASSDPSLSAGAAGDGAGRERIFVFNGDADGLVGQHILGLELGPPDLRVTGRKRDIELLRKLPPRDRADVRVLDISLARNLDALPALLARSNLQITWYDHHDPGSPPAHAGLALHINQAPETCTAAIVNSVHGLKHPLWAAMAAFGDNLPATASALASTGGASAHEAALLRRVGVLLNYNAYGEEPGDVLFEPADLAARLAPFRDAFGFCREESILGPLAAQFESDRERFQELKPLAAAPGAGAFLVPDEPFARRYGATWANERALQEPGRALAVIHPNRDGTYLVSIRAPRQGNGAPARPASDLAKEFPTGGGRRLAAGINALPADLLDAFLARFSVFFAD
ncbi:MAG TPA: hypothetical protein VJ385_02615 [Fibrobacteria bacterium]|nr:hypothetical protein [Fibrobacteria bacterium]